MVLMSGQIKDIHGMLMYYFKCLNVADDIKQVIGVNEAEEYFGIFAQMSSSFLKSLTTLLAMGVNRGKTCI